jgi:hypothetical protein
MGSGVLAYKTKKERLKPLFFCSTLSMLDNRSTWIESAKLHILRAIFLFGRLASRARKNTGGMIAVVQVADRIPRYADG